MKLEELAGEIPGLSGWTHTSKIRLFGWFLHSQQGMERFGVADVRSCYDTLHLGRPANISQLLVALSQRSSREVLRDSQGYYLERKVRDRLEAKYGHRPATVQVHKLLEELPTRLTNTAERAYLDEALICFKHQAFRAAIVMCWNLAFDHLCEYVLRNQLGDFNAKLPIRFPKADISKVSTRDDFTQLKESQVVEVCRAAEIIPTNTTKVLREKLEKRNLAAHPSGVRFNQLQAEEYIVDLINNVALKLQ